MRCRKDYILKHISSLKAAQSITKQAVDAHHLYCNRKYIVTTHDAHHKQSRAAVCCLFAATWFLPIVCKMP
jgi:hypothetical protein